jgi:hypothetical protein
MGEAKCRQLTIQHDQKFDLTWESSLLAQGDLLAWVVPVILETDMDALRQTIRNVTSQWKFHGNFLSIPIYYEIPISVLIAR